MKKTIKIILISIFTFIILTQSVGFVFAQDSVGGKNANSDVGGKNAQATPPPANSSSGIFTLQNPLRSDINSIGALVQAFVEIITYIAIIVAVLAFIWVGFQYVTSAATGNATKIKDLHNKLMWLVIGVAVVISARVIIQVVINTISATGTVSPTVIQSANNALQGK